jgi:uncharacterized protein (UPF0335 family)
MKIQLMIHERIERIEAEYKNLRDNLEEIHPEDDPETVRARFKDYVFHYESFNYQHIVKHF